MRENEPVLLVLFVCDGEIILEKGEILSEKRHVFVVERAGKGPIVKMMLLNVFNERVPFTVLMKKAG